jgi:hypothetical protein
MIRALVPIALAALLAATPALAGARDATPAAYPLTPDPAGCRVAPRALEEVAAVVATPAAAPASPTPFARPAGEPADAATAAAVEGTVRELFACVNGGAFLRFFALFTDDYLRGFLAGTPMDADVAALFAADPAPLPEAERRVIVRIGEAEALPDGRVGVVVVLDEPADPRTEEPDYVVLERVGGRWLVDAVVEDGGLAGTPTPGTPHP